MADHQQEDDQESMIIKKIQYPLDPKSYHLLDEIGRGMTAVVYKAVCTTRNSSLVAIKSIDLDRSRTEFENVRREAQTMSLLSHPNILKAHCSFTVDHRLWVVMPFMSAGSLQSIIASSFPDGLPEPCIAIILKETLMGLCYLHDQGHLHRDIKAGNILMDSDGSIKLGDFGVSASIYDSKSCSLTALNEITGTPYWMAPEVIRSHNGYSYKADIWSFGITALELAHGRPPLSDVPLVESVIRKITKRFRFSDYERQVENKKHRHKFSKYFKDMVSLCLDQDPSKRPCGEKLLKHSFFKNVKGSDFLVKNVLHGLPSVEQRFKEKKLQRLNSMSYKDDELFKEDTELDDEESWKSVKSRRISGWNFDLEGFKLDPVFPSKSGQDDGVVEKTDPILWEKMVQEESSEDASIASSPGIGGVTGSGGVAEFGGGFDREMVVGKLSLLKKSLEDQREQVIRVLNMVGEEEGNREEQLIQLVDNLSRELGSERKKNSDLEMELELLKLKLCALSTPATNHAA